MITLFHRVDDDLAGNVISCTSAEFRRFCDFFSRFFDVISLSELLDRLESGSEVAGCLVITFDDGYADNEEVAAAELRERGFPATFFVATGWIGSEEVPWWDEEHGVVPRWMTWDQVRALQRGGFDVGAHTMHHVDLGEVGGEEAHREIVGSRERLERELGRPVLHFSYPYGRAHQITEANRKRVEDAGFRCCLSAFGGTVAPGADPMRLRRTAVTQWHRSPYQWGLEILMGDAAADDLERGAAAAAGEGAATSLR